MKSYTTPKLELQIVDAQDIVRTSGVKPTNGVSVGEGGNDINNWYLQF